MRSTTGSNGRRKRLSRNVSKNPKNLSKSSFEFGYDLTPNSISSAFVRSIDESSSSDEESIAMNLDSMVVPTGKHDLMKIQEVYE